VVVELGRHRSRLKILANILSMVNDNNGAKKTQIMYQAYLSYDLLVKYLRDLIQSDLVVCGEENYYLLAPKGEEFLAKFSEYEKNREGIDKQLNHIESQKLMLEQMCICTNMKNDASRNMNRNIEERH